MSKREMLLLLLLSTVAQAQVIDNWAFSSPEQRQTALNIAGELRCPQCQNQSLLE